MFLSASNWIRIYNKKEHLYRYEQGQNWVKAEGASGEKDESAKAIKSARKAWAGSASFFSNFQTVIFKSIKYDIDFLVNLSFSWSVKKWRKRQGWGGHWPHHMCHDRQHLHAVSSTTFILQKPRPDYLCYDNKNIAWWGRRDQGGINCCKWEGAIKVHHKRKPQYTYGQWHHTQAPKTKARLLMLW